MEPIKNIEMVLRQVMHRMIRMTQDSFHCKQLEIILRRFYRFMGNIFFLLSKITLEMTCRMKRLQLNDIIQIQDCKH